MMGNVKAFILSICSAVVFATLLVSANTMAMSIRERTREVAVLKTLGFTRRSVLGLFVSEAVALSLAGGLLGADSGWLMVYGLTHSPQFFSFFPLKVTLRNLDCRSADIGRGRAVEFGSCPPTPLRRSTSLTDLRHIG